MGVGRWPWGGGCIYTHSHTTWKTLNVNQFIAPLQRSLKVVAGVLDIYVPGGLHSLLYT